MNSQIRYQGGFTLIEIMAALVLIGVVLPAVMKGLSMASILASDSEAKYEAVGLAESKMAEVLLNEDWQEGSDNGNLEPDYPDYQWTMATSDWTQADLKEVDVTVSWMDRGRPREIVLTTLVYDAD